MHQYLKYIYQGQQFFVDVYMLHVYNPRVRQRIRFFYDYMIPTRITILVS